jgi:hypothetical protein
MKRIRILVLAVVTVCAASAITATAVQASEGPFYAYCEQVEPGTGKYKEALCKELGGVSEFEKFKMLGFEFRTLEGKLHSTEFVIENGALIIICKKLHLEKATIKGSAAKNPGTSEEVMVLEECAVGGNGTPCKIVGSKITTEPLKNTLAFSKNGPAKGDIHLVFYEAVKPSLLAKIKFEGAGCVLLETPLEGTVGGQLDNQAKELLKLEENETLGEIALVTFPTALIKADWIEKEGALKEVTASMTLGPKKVTKFEGKVELKAKVNLVQVKAWGVFTH